jgi:6-phosphogluconolactonase (cycloisomerase 2 family)
MPSSPASSKRCIFSKGREDMSHRWNGRLAQAVFALAVVANNGLLFGANSHVYAVVNGNIDIYDVGNDGSLSFQHTFQPPAGPVGQVAVTPDGRFLYATESAPTCCAAYIVQYGIAADGSLGQKGSPFILDNPRPALHSLTMHPSGSSLFVMDGIAITVYGLAIDSRDGHLTQVAHEGTGLESGDIAVDPDGDLLYASRKGGAGCDDGRMITFQIGPGGTLTAIFVFVPPGGNPPPISSAWNIAADSRFVYAFTNSFCNFQTPPGTLGLLRAGEDGSLKLVKTYPWAAMGKKIGRFLVLGRDTSMFVYTVDQQGNLTQTDSAPIQVFSLTSDTSASHLFVATDDGIVTYRLSSDGRLTRISKVTVMNASGLTFSSGGPCSTGRGDCDSQN